MKCAAGSMQTARCVNDCAYSHVLMHTESMRALLGRKRSSTQ
jgi:hypothetical protein